MVLAIVTQTNSVCNGFERKIPYFFLKEALIKSARADSERFFSSRRVQKRRNTLCTRKGYAASVSQLVLATAALYFPVLKPHG